MGLIAAAICAPNIARGDDKPRIDGVVFTRPKAMGFQNVQTKTDPTHSFEFYHKAVNRPPKLRAVCQTAQGVANVIGWARDNGKKFSVRSTGHDFAGHSHHDELIIDTGFLNNINIDSANGRFSTGPGSRGGAVYIALAKAGLGMGGGTFESVGMAGITLGGGIGHFSRYAGLLADQLESLKMVTPRGEIIHVSQTENSDLFWACRGGGGTSFGIVTELNYRAFELSQLVYFNAPVWTSVEDTIRILHAWPQWNAALPQQVTSHLRFTPYSGGRFLIYLNGMSLLQPEETKSRLVELLGRGQPGHANWMFSDSPVDIFKRLYGQPHFIPVTDQITSSQVFDKIPDKAQITDLIRQLGRYSPNSLILNLESLGGAVAKRTSQDTPFPHRNAHFIIHYLRVYANQTQHINAVKAMADARAILQPFTSGGVYVNYPEPDLENWQTAYWGKNLARLRAIKRGFDPENVFRHAQSVPL